MDQVDKQQQGGFFQSAGVEARVLSEIAKSPGFFYLSKFSCLSSPKKPTSVQSISCIDSLLDHWYQFAVGHQNKDIYLNSNSQAKWRAMINVKFEL